MDRRAIKKITRVTMAIESRKTVEIIEITANPRFDKPRNVSATTGLSGVHPGRILHDEFLEPLGMSSEQLARDTDMAPVRVAELVDGTRRITTDTASRLSKYFGVAADYWLELQDNYDAAEEMRNSQAYIEAPLPALQVS
jgi:antitoxin HigA-1